MYASIQDAFSKLLHIKDGCCIDFLAYHDVGYQHANFQKYRTCGKKVRDICLSLLFFWDTRVSETGAAKNEYLLNQWTDIAVIGLIRMS